MSIDRRDFLRLSMATSMAGLTSSLACREGRLPNVLFIASDDLNDWVGCLGGHPDALTPNLESERQERSQRRRVRLPTVPTFRPEDAA